MTQKSAVVSSICTLFTNAYAFHPQRLKFLELNIVKKIISNYIIFFQVSTNRIRIPTLYLQANHQPRRSGRAFCKLKCLGEIILYVLSLRIPQRVPYVAEYRTALALHTKRCGNENNYSLHTGLIVKSLTHCQHLRLKLR